jgi:hypothetical protein
MKSTDLANVNFTFGRHLKLVDLDWTSFENCNGKFNGIDNIEIFRMSGFNCADICDEFLTIVDNKRDMFEFGCNICICLEIFDISRVSLDDELLVPYISPARGTCPDMSMTFKLVSWRSI